MPFPEPSRDKVLLIGSIVMIFFEKASTLHYGIFPCELTRLHAGRLGGLSKRTVPHTVNLHSDYLVHRIVSRSVELLGTLFASNKRSTWRLSTSVHLLDFYKLALDLTIFSTCAHRLRLLLSKILGCDVGHGATLVLTLTAGCGRGPSVCGLYMP